jgi:hypothetical protein
MQAHFDASAVIVMVYRAIRCDTLADANGT